MSDFPLGTLLPWPEDPPFPESGWALADGGPVPDDADPVVAAKLAAGWHGALPDMRPATVYIRLRWQ